MTNLGGIILSGGLVFIWQDYGSVRRAKKGLTVSSLVLFLLGIPLSLALRDLIVEEKTRSLVSQLIRQETYTFKDTNIRNLTVDAERAELRVDLEVAVPMNTISEKQVSMVHRFLEQELNRPVSLEVNIFPVEAYSIRKEGIQTKPVTEDSRR